MRTDTRKRIFAAGLGASLGLLGGCSDGADGASCSVSQNDAGAAVIECTDGTSAEVPPGMDGVDGTDGEPGMDGVPGESCTVTDAMDGGARVSCDDGTSVVVPPGPSGEQGPPGTSENPFGVSERGVKINVQSVTIPDDRRPVAELTITDANDVGLDVMNFLSSGEVGFRFTFAHVPDNPNPEFDGPGSYVNYIVRGNGQPGDESGSGEWTLLDPVTGSYEYRFELELPADFDPSETHVMSALAERTVGELTLLGDDFYAFVPDGSADPTLREVSTDATCNGCHTRLTVHGDHRSGYQVCLTCHTQDAVDPESGNSIAFAQMLHKIHMGANLPSSNTGDPADRYCIIGYGGSEHCYDNVHFPQDPNNCVSCHTGDDRAWLADRPTVEACGSCHDDVWFREANDPDAPDDLWPGDPDDAARPGDAWVILHQGGVPWGNEECVNCHNNIFTGCDDPLSPSGSDKCDAYTVHYNEFTDPAATIFEIDQLEVIVPDPVTDPLQIRFRARTGTNADGASTPITDPNELQSLRVSVAGPNEDYANTTRVEFDGADLAAPVHEGDGVFTTQLLSGAVAQNWAQVVDAMLADPAFDANTASLTFTMRGGYDVNVGQNNEYTAFTLNPIEPMTLSGNDLVTRRDVVADDKCNTCHKDLRYTAHRGRYRTVRQCNICHMASDGTPPRLGPLAHEIHGQQWALDGDGMVIEPHTGYPGDERNCEGCHLPETYGPELPAGVLRTAQETMESVAPLTSMCTGCHNAPETVAHAEINTYSDGTEVCVTCHGSGKTFGVDVVHAIPQPE